MSNSTGAVNRDLPRMIVSERTEANTTMPPLPVMSEEFKYGGEWMDPQWKKDIRTGKKLFSVYPLQMVAILLATAGVAIGLGLGSNACAASRSAQTTPGGQYSENYPGGYSEGEQGNTGEQGGEVGDSDALLGTGSAVSGNVGNIAVSINGYKFTKDYDDIDSIMVEYTITNNGSESTYFYFLDHRTYQNGTQLAVSIAKTDAYDNQEQILEVTPGASHTVHCLYNLRSLTDPVEVKVTDLANVSGQTVGTTFALSGESTPTQPQEPEDNGDISGDITDFHVVVAGYELFTDNYGDNNMLLSLDLTNNSDEATSAFFALEFYAEQDGAELNFDTPYFEDYNNSYTTDIQPGATGQVNVVFGNVNMDGGDIKVRLYDFFDDAEEIKFTCPMY